MAKPVGSRCNLACPYCYYRDKGASAGDDDSWRMSDALLEDYVRGAFAANPGPVVSFVWHGGEPTLAGIDFYRRAVAHQERNLPAGWSCWNDLQTNGVLLDDDWCAFLAENRFDVGVSLDGTRTLHDANRRDVAGQPSYDRVVASVRRLQAHGIQPDLLCTVTSDSAREPLPVYRALRDLGTGWIQFIPIVRRTPDGRTTADSVMGVTYGDFLCGVFDEWSSRDFGRLDVQLFAELQLVLSGGTASVCWMNPTCGRVPVLERDGSVYSCDHFVDATHRIGDVATSTLGELVESSVQTRFGRDKRDLLPSRCLGCNWLALCNGGCPKDRFDRTGEEGREISVLCEGMQRFFRHAMPVLDEIVRLRKSGADTPAIRARLAEQR